MPYKSCKYTCTIILLIVYVPREVKKNCNIDTSWPLQTDMLRTMLNVTMFQSRALTRCTPYTLV